MNCIHWWIIDPPNGNESNAECKNCKETRVFFNTFSAGVWSAGKETMARTLTPMERDLELTGR